MTGNQDMPKQLPMKVVTFLALIQGLALSLAYQSVENSFWPGSHFPSLNAWVAFFLSFPTLFLLLCERSDWKKLAIYLLGFCVSLSALAAYMGTQLLVIDGRVRSESLVVIFTICALIGSFKFSLYIKPWVNKQKMSYELLFRSSWQLFLLFSEAALFTLIFFGILHLGAGLFDLLGITFFTELLDQQWFWLPALSLSSAFAIYKFRNTINIVENIANILQTLMKFLLPVLVCVSLSFLATLPFVGFEKLWDTGRGTFLVLTVQFLTLFFVNAVYQKAKLDHPYPKFLHRIVIAGIACLPIYGCIAAYGLWLRIEQYGLTVDRCWALALWAFLFAFSIAYFYSIIRYRDNWLNLQSKINVVMGGAVLVYVLAVQSPLLNFQSISANSQLERLNAGKVDINDFGFSYFRYNLHMQGFLALEEYKKGIASTHPDIVIKIDKLYQDTPNFQRFNDIDDAVEKIVFLSPEKEIPDSLIDFFKTDPTKRSIVAQTHNHLVITDLNRDGEDEYVLISDNTMQQTAWMFTQSKDKTWRRKRLSLIIPKGVNLQQALKEANFENKRPEWDNLVLGELVIKHY